MSIHAFVGIGPTLLEKFGAINLKHLYQEVPGLMAII